MKKFYNLETWSQTSDVGFNLNYSKQDKSSDASNASQNGSDDTWCPAAASSKLDLQYDGSRVRWSFRKDCQGVCVLRSSVQCDGRACHRSEAIIINLKFQTSRIVTS